MRNQETSKPQEFIEGFRVFDKEQNGMISAAELRHLLTSLGERLQPEEMDQLLAGMENAQGQVNYEGKITRELILSMNTVLFDKKLFFVIFLAFSKDVNYIQF